MQWAENFAKEKLAEMQMDDLPIIPVHPQKKAVQTDWFQKYRILCHEFIRSLKDCTQELAFMNLNQDEFMNILMGREIPENLSIRFRVPLVFGGNLEIENLFMCWTFPQSHNLDRFIIEQYENDIIWLPNPIKKIYLSAHTTNGGNGGNTASDRLSQLASQIVSNRNLG